MTVGHDPDVCSLGSLTWLSLVGAPRVPASVASPHSTVTLADGVEVHVGFGFTIRSAVAGAGLPTSPRPSVTVTPYVCASLNWADANVSSSVRSLLVLVRTTLPNASFHS